VHTSFPVELHIDCTDLIFWYFLQSVVVVIIDPHLNFIHFNFEEYYSLFKILNMLDYHLTLQVEDSELADVAAVSAGNNYEIGNMIAEAMKKVGRQGVVTLEEGKSAENNLYVVEGMQFDRGYISPYFVTDSEKMTVEYENCKV